MEAGLSQTELARLARTSQPAIARYESGATTPSLRTLERVLEACGRSLREARIGGVVRGAGTTAAPHARDRLARSKRRLLAAARRHGIRRVRVFGSVARATERPMSDIDLLVELTAGRTLVDVAGFRQDAAEILGVPVDVATVEILKRDVRTRVLRDARPL